MKNIKITASDWSEIFYALQFKRDHGPAVEGDERWRAQLNCILNKIGPDGAEAARRGAKPCRTDEWTVVLLLPDTHTSNYGQDHRVIRLNSRTVLSAVKTARNKVIVELSDPDLNPEDIYLVAVFNGNHENWKPIHERLCRRLEKK